MREPGGELPDHERRPRQIPPSNSAAKPTPEAGQIVHMLPFLNGQREAELRRAEVDGRHDDDDYRPDGRLSSIQVVID